jgi:uncharacterized protein (TIGR02246 family)
VKLPGLAFLVSVQLANPQDLGLPAKLAAMRAEWAEDLRTKKDDGYVRLDADDGVFLEPTGARITGKSAITALMKHVMATFNSNITLHSVSVEVSGTLAYDSGDYVETLTPRAAGKPMQVQGTYLTIFKRQPDGQWRIMEQMWSQGK